MKISRTLRQRGIDNFSAWREEMRRSGEIPDTTKPLTKDNSLALLIGLTLGDGHIENFPRCERLTITLGTDKPKLITFAYQLVGKVFGKFPNVRNQKGSNCMKIDLYQRSIARRIGVTSGNRRYDVNGIPKWIWRKKKFLVSCIKGLYEAEASLNFHEPTYTCNFAFHNRNKKLLSDVYKALVRFGLHPEVRPVAIRIRRKNEVKYLRELLSFREYCRIG